MLLNKCFRPIITVNTFRFFSNNFNIPSTKGKISLNTQLRIRLAAAYRGLDSYGLNEGICNHLSAMAPAANTDEDVMLIIPFGLHWSEVTASLLIGVDAENNVVEGRGHPEVTALCIHRGIYKKRPDIKAVMHTHMPYATALTCLKQPELLMIHQNSARFYQRIAYDTAYNGLGGNFEEGERLGNALGSKNVLFMGNHGVMTVAESIDVAFDNMYYLERAAMIQVLSCSTQQKLKEMDKTVVELTSKSITDELPLYAKSHLDSIIRRLSVSCKEFSINQT